MKNHENLPKLIAIAFDISHKNQIKTYWSFELVCNKKLIMFVPYLDRFC
ncbi:MAG: hypothetical protein ACI9XR_000297 [Flavobacterium sp.]|jgi:hypothetical protein